MYHQVLFSFRQTQEFSISARQWTKREAGKWQAMLAPAGQVTRHFLH